MSPAVKIEYSAISRGYYKKITVQNQTVWIQNERDKNAVKNKIAAAKWEKIVTEFKKINPESLPILKAPTQKRFYDGAAIGKFDPNSKSKNLSNQWL